MSEGRSVDPFGPPEPGMFAQMEGGRRGEILDAAMGVFADRGYDGGSMRDIARRVGVTEPALYRHFPGKEALFLALMRAAGGRLRDEAFQLVASVRPDGLRGQILAVLSDRRRATRRFGPVLRTVLSAVTHNPQFMDAYRAEIVEPVRRALVAKVEELDGTLGGTAADRDARVRALMSLVVGYFVTSAVLADSPDDAIADAVIRVMGWSADA